VKRKSCSARERKSGPRGKGESPSKQILNSQSFEMFFISVDLVFMKRELNLRIT